MAQGLGRTVLVTGASRGIGRAIVLCLAKDGFDLVVNDIQKQSDALEEVCAEVAKFGRKCVAVYADVSDGRAVRAMAAEAISKAGNIDGLVNNAGILIPSPVAELQEATWDAVMNVNAKGTFLVTQALLGPMVERGYGRIVNIASIGGKHGAQTEAHYSASKAAVMGFTRVLAQEVGTRGVTANCICPGIIVTDMGKGKLDDPENANRWINITAMRRLGHPEDVAGPVSFLLSDAAAFITGQTLNVDGGIVLS